MILQLRSLYGALYPCLAVLALLVVAAVPAAANSASDTVDPAPPADAESGNEGETEAATDAPAEGASAEPEKEWLFDEEKGRRYTIERVPKVEKAYLWVDDHHIRLPGGLRKVPVVDHDDKWFWIKLYEPNLRCRQPRKKGEPTPTEPTPEELGAIATTYESDLEAVDRLTLEAFDKGLPQRGQWRNGFDVADMNEDGHPDIVFGPSRKGRMRPNIFLGDGAGGWTYWSEARYPNLPYDYGDAEAADFNGDGHQDLAFGIHLRGLLVLIGDGKGNFEAWSEGIPLERPGHGGDASSFSSRAIDSVDWNRDGRMDLLALGEGPKGLKTARGRGGRPQINNARGLVIFINGGDGTWKAQRVEKYPRDFGDDFAVADLNRDDRPDVLMASNISGNRSLLRTSTEGEELLESTNLSPVRPGFVSSVAIADLDGDGAQDLLVAYRAREARIWRSGIDIYFAEGEGWDRRPLAAEESMKGVTALEAGDLDGDDRLDIAALTGEGELWIFLGKEGRAFVAEQTPEGPAAETGCQGWEVRITDLDGDNRNELAATFAGERVGPGGFPELTHPGCKGGGRIAVWKPTLASGKTAEAPAP